VGKRKVFLNISIPKLHEFHSIPYFREEEDGGGEENGQVPLKGQREMEGKRGRARERKRKDKKEKLNKKTRSIEEEKKRKGGTKKKKEKEKEKEKGKEKDKSSDSEEEERDNSNSIMLNVFIPILFLSKRMVFRKKETVLEVIDKVALKMKLPKRSKSCSYGLFMAMKNVWISDVTSPLSSLGLLNYDEVEFRVRPSTRISVKAPDMKDQHCEVISVNGKDKKASQIPDSHVIDIEYQEEDGKKAQMAVTYGVPCATIVKTLQKELESSMEHVVNLGLVSRAEKKGGASVDYFLPPDTEFGSLEFSEKTVLKLKPVQVVVDAQILTHEHEVKVMKTKLRLTGQKESVKSVKNKLLSRYLEINRNIQNFQLFLSFGRDPFRFSGVLLDPSHCISSFPISSNDCLKMGLMDDLQKDNKAAHQKERNENEVVDWTDKWLQITCPDHPLPGARSVLFLLDTNLVIADIRRLYFHVFPCSFSPEFQVRITEGNNERYPEDMKRLRTLIPSSEDVNFTFSFQLKLKAKSKKTPVLGLRSSQSMRKNKSQRVEPSSSPSSSSSGVFGVPISSLPSSTSPEGFNVPDVIILLKKTLVLNNSLKMDGIFRQAGAEEDVREIIAQLNNGTYQPAAELTNMYCHAVVSVTKRWISETPPPILGSVEESVLVKGSTSIKIATEMKEGLQQPEKDVFAWLVRLLAEISLNSDINRMSIDNLAIILAPVLIPFPEDDPMKGVQLTQMVVNILKLLIDKEMGELKEKGDEGEEDKGKEKEREESSDVESKEGSEEEQKEKENSLPAGTGKKEKKTKKSTDSSSSPSRPPSPSSPAR